MNGVIDIKILVVYNSKTGFTEEYAQQIARDLQCDILSYYWMTQSDVANADVLIYGSRIHAGRVDGLSRMKKMLSDYPNTNFLVFATGATPASAADVIQRIWNDNLTDSEKKTIPHYYFQSGLRYDRMSVFDRTIMKLVAMFMGKKKNKTDNEAGFEKAIQSSYDNSASDYALPLINYVKEKYQ